MEELYFNDIKIELPENTISQTKQVNDIGDVKDRQSNYSNNIKIPKTDKNVATFEMLGIAGNVTVIPYNEIKIKYSDDGIELISNGTGIVKNTNDYYNLVIYDGNINLSDTIGSKQLRTLDWSSYNHQLTNATYVSGVNKTSGYIYSFADFYDGLGNINIDRQIPSLFVHTIWNEIFTQNGLTYSGNIFTDADFKSRIFTPSKGYDTTIVSGANVNQSTNIGNGNINYVDSVPTQHIDVVKSGTFTDSGDYVLNLIGTINRDAADLVTITVKANNVVVFTKVLYNTSGINESTFNESLSLSQGNGDTYSVEILTASEEFPHYYRVFLNWNITTLSIDILPKYVNIDFATMFSDETQLAFVKDIMQHFGILFKRQRNTDNYEFTTIKELLNDTLNADDWSDKYSSVTNESYKSGYAQINYGKYIYDDLNTNIEQTFADGQIDVNDVNIQATKTLFTSIFKASNFADGSLQYFKCKAWELDDEEIIQPLENGLRLFKKTEELKTISYGWSDSLSKITDTITVSYLDFTSQDYQSEFDNYYSEFNAVLNNYKKITINCNLSLIDIYELDFFKLKYFKQLGRYYYLNKVLSFKKNRITKVELIEVRGFTPTELPVGSMVARLTSGSTVLANLTKYSGKLLKARLTGGSNMSATLTKYISVNLVAHLTSGSTMSAIMNKEVECCGIESVVQGSNITIDVTDPKNPIISADSGGSQDLQSVTDVGNITTNSIIVEGFGKSIRAGVSATNFAYLGYDGLVASSANNVGNQIIVMDSVNNQISANVGNANKNIIKFIAATQENTHTLQNKSGTIAHTSDIPTSDNYNGWYASRNGSYIGTISSAETLNFQAGTNVSLSGSSNSIIINADTQVSNTAYGVGWNGVTTIAPSKNAVYDKIESLALGGGIALTDLSATSPILYNNATGVFSHATNGAQGSVNGSGRTYIQDITLDSFGHITGLATATETVVNTDTIYTLTKAKVEAVLTGEISSHTHAGGSGTVTEVNAGLGMTQSGDPNINPTLNVNGGNGIVANAGNIQLTTLASAWNAGNTHTITANDFINGSDRRLKTKIEDMDYEEINSRYRQFEFKSVKGVTRCGVIAQELKETNPEFVSELDGTLQVSYIDLHSAEIHLLKKENKQMRSELDDLKKLVQELINNK